MLSAGIAGARSGMSIESDGSGRSDDIVVIKQLLQKLEEAASRDAETPRDGLQLAESAGNAIGDEPVREGPPLLVLRSSRGAPSPNAAPPTVGEASIGQGNPEFSRSAISIDVPGNDAASATAPIKPLPVKRRPGVAVAGMSFALGIIAAAGLIVAFDPFGQRDRGAVGARAPLPELSSVSTGPSPGTAEQPLRNSAAERAGEVGEGQGRRASTDNASAGARTDMTASGGPANISPADVETKREPAKQVVAGATDLAQSASASDKIGLRVASRIELKAGERRSIDVRVDAQPSEAQRLLVVFRQVPAWMTFSKGGAIGNDIWLLPAQQVGDLEVEVNEGVNGAADVKVQLAKVDGSILSETSVSFVANSPILAPATAGVASSAGSEATILRLQARGELLLDTGEVEAARTLLRTAAESGSVAAALRLAETYDPAEVQRLGMADRSADLGQAVRWYEHAQALGSPVAAARLVALGRR